MVCGKYVKNQKASPKTALTPNKNVKNNVTSLYVKTLKQLFTTKTHFTELMGTTNNIAPKKRDDVIKYFNCCNLLSQRILCFQSHALYSKNAYKTATTF
jgi:hypothetical protein